ncbi:hypothetical protein MO867_17995 [Microbulbifer sp. OS29]|uniref:Uncharacterized protein n=1 Tax=Microbulbifer okhotskensis TaxID=2926617 RepID=A0A9X2J940_9GAMM|nr:hypothetical protein [Microbulbifer okhotskensis]MCO1336226.1 hypothetical protein [Microbulbifer okhotskensis]
MDVSVKLDTSKFDKASAELKKQLPYASSVALNNVAFRIRGEERAAIGRIFANPANLTLNSVLVKKATKRSGVAKIFIRDQAPNGTAPSQYLAPSVIDENRADKRFERALRHAGLLPRGMYVVHGKEAKLNKHGNISVGIYKRILAELRANSGAKKSGADGVQGTKSKYFVGKVTGKRNKQWYGVWKRAGGKRNPTAKPILIFLKGRPNYRQRFPFVGIAQGIARRHLPIELDKAMDHAIKTSKR